MLQRALPLENRSLWKPLKGHQGLGQDNGGHGLRGLRIIPGLGYSYYDYEVPWDIAISSTMWRPGPYASFLKGQGHKGISSLVAPYEEIVNFYRAFQGYQSMQSPGGIEATAFVASVKYQYQARERITPRALKFVAIAERTS